MLQPTRQEKNFCRIFVCRIPRKYHSVSSTLQLLQPKKTAPNLWKHRGIKLPETTTTPMKIGLIFQPLMSRGLVSGSAIFSTKKNKQQISRANLPSTTAPLAVFQLFFSPKAPSKKAISVAKCSRCATRCWNAGVAPIQIPVDTWKTLAEVFDLNPQRVGCFQISPLKFLTWRDGKFASCNRT